MKRLVSIRATITENETTLQSCETKIQEQKAFIEDKKASLKKCKSASKVSCNSWKVEKSKVMDMIAMKEEEMLTLENKRQGKKLQRMQIQSSERMIENLEVEISLLKKRLEEKQGTIERLEIRCRNQTKNAKSHVPLQRYKEELKNKVHTAENRVQKLQHEQETEKKSLESAERDILLWETRLLRKKEEQEQIVSHLKEDFDTSTISQLESKRKQRLDIKRAREELHTEAQIMGAQLGTLSPQESALPAWPLHACFKFRPELEKIPHYINAMNIIAGFMKKVCITETTHAAGKLLQMWDKNGSSNKFYRIWPLDRLKLEEDLKYRRTIQSTYPEGSIILPVDLLQYDHKFDKAVNRAFGRYVISSTDIIGRDLALQKNIWNVTVDGKVNRFGSVSGGWRGSESSGYLHIKLKKDKADVDLALLTIEQVNVEKEIEELEKYALEIEACKVREEMIQKDISFAEEQINCLKNEAARHQTQLYQCDKWIAFDLNDLEVSKKQLDAFVTDLDSETGVGTLQKALADAKKEEAALHQALEQLYFQQEEVCASKMNLSQKALQEAEEEMGKLIGFHKKELSALREKMSQIQSAMERAAEEERAQAEMLIVDTEAVDRTNIVIADIKEDTMKIQKILIQAKKDEDKIVEELNASPQPPDEMTMEVKNIAITDMHECAAIKHKLKKMIAEIEQINMEHQSMSLAEQVAIKERAEKLQVFKERRASIIDSIDILVEGIEISRKRVQEANEVFFEKIRQSFINSCKYLLPNKLVDLIKVGQRVEDGVKFSFSNVPHESGHAGQEWKTNLDELSGGQRTLLSFAFLMMVATSGQSPLYVMDEVDAALDEENQNRVAKLILNIVAKGSQVICVSHNISFQKHSHTVIEVTRADGTTKLHQTYASSQVPHHRNRL